MWGYGVGFVVGEFVELLVGLVVGREVLEWVVVELEVFWVLSGIF